MGFQHTSSVISQPLSQQAAPLPDHNILSADLINLIPELLQTLSGTGIFPLPRLEDLQPRLDSLQHLTHIRQVLNLFLLLCHLWPGKSDHRVQTALHFLHLLFYPCHLLQHSTDVQSCSERQSHIGSHIDRQNCCQNILHRLIDRQNQMFHRFMDNPDHDNGQKSPGQRGPQTYISMQIKWVIAVIPVPHFEQSLHTGSCDILQNRGCRSSKDERQNQTVSHRNGHKQQ